MVIRYTSVARFQKDLVELDPSELWINKKYLAKVYGIRHKCKIYLGDGPEFFEKDGMLLLHSTKYNVPICNECKKRYHPNAVASVRLKDLHDDVRSN